MCLCWLYVLPCWLLSLSVRGGMFEAVHAHESESCPAGSQNVWERKFSMAQTILVTMSRDGSFFFFFFAWAQIKMRRRSWKHVARVYSVQLVSRNYLIYESLTTFVSRTVLDSIFRIFSAPRALRQPFRIYKNVNPMIW